MKQERLLKVLVGPVISEKSTRLEEYKDKQYAFVVTQAVRFRRHAVRDEAGSEGRSRTVLQGAG